MNVYVIEMSNNADYEEFHNIVTFAGTAKNAVSYINDFDFEKIGDGEYSYNNFYGLYAFNNGKPVGNDETFEFGRKLEALFRKRKDEYYGKG